MNCAETEILLHALIDGELDAGHARDVEGHLAACPGCTAKLRSFRAMHNAISGADLKEAAPAMLRRRIEAALPALRRRPEASTPFWRTFLGGFGTGTALSGLVAAMLVLAVIRSNQDAGLANEIVSAHLRSLQAGHLTDVLTSDQHTVKPWFNGKLDVAPPVIDLTAQGFTLIGGRLDSLDGKSVGSIVYQRRKHVINLFVTQRSGTTRNEPKLETAQGFNILHWTEDGLQFWAISDINAEELDEFGQKFAAASRPPASSS